MTAAGSRFCTVIVAGCTAVAPSPSVTRTRTVWSPGSGQAAVVEEPAPVSRSKVPLPSRSHS